MAEASEPAEPVKQQNDDVVASNHHPLPAKPPPTEIAEETVDDNEAKDSSIPTAVESQDVAGLKDSEMVDAPPAPAQERTPVPETAIKTPADEPVEKPVEEVVEKPADIVKPSNSAVDVPIETVKKEPSDAPEANADVDMDTPSAPAVHPSSSATAMEETQTSTVSDGPVRSSADDVKLEPASLSNLALDASQEDDSTPITADTSMTDVPSQPSAKVAREREEDVADEPAPKRARTSGAEEGPDDGPAPQPEQPAPEVMVIDQPAQPAGGQVPLSVDGKPKYLNDPELANNPITLHQAREIRKVLDGLKKTKNGGNFKQSVKILWPQLWDAYSSVVSNPTDLSTMGQKLRDSKYTTMGEFRSEINRLIENSASFNGADHAITASAKHVVEQLYVRLSEVPAEAPARPTKQEPKQLPTRHAEPRAPPPTAASASASVTAPAPSPAAPRKESRPSVATPTEKVSESSVFAVPASGMPLIRRDSTKNNDADRPKRPIHPPKNKDLGFQPKNLKKKKLPIFKFCEEALNEVKKGKYAAWNQYFLEPVDPVALNIPMYHKVVKRPMDLGTMTNKLQDGEYDSHKAFEADFHLVIKNCNLFNPEGHAVREAGKELERIFKAKWAEKDDWMAKHAPPPAARGASPHGDKDDSDEEDDGSDQERAQNDEEIAQKKTLEGTVARVREEQKRLDDMLEAPMPDLSAINAQRAVLTMFQNLSVDQRTQLANLQKKKPTSKAKPAKKKTNGSAAGGGASAPKKAGGGGGGNAARKAGGGNTKKAPRTRKLNEFEKAIVSNGISDLDGGALEKAIDIIKKDTNIQVRTLPVRPYIALATIQLTRCSTRSLKTVSSNWIWTS